ncbi:MAG TPA: DNA polymerase III subunit gamma/tau [Gammaproteobacteria bacterium]|nr:DNA polymerase III subunit gamma/tau [Gammaproteobacteria bacterium]
MSYTVLALKWRPRKFADLVGQEHVVRALVNSLADNRLHHAYLFSGTRGVGKTTVARILAKALNCETGIVPEPCGVCRACVAIDEGRFIDLMEVDAASRTKVDDTRELLENVQYSPTAGRFKVYLIDEVHMLSNHSFNALLKTLEEPPPRVKFLFATTDPQKLPATVLSRCLQFNLRKLTAAEISAQLERICVAEKIAAEADGLKAIARAAEGSMRDALSLLDQAIAFGGGRIEAAAVNSMLGNIDRGHVLRMLDALSRQDGAALLGEVDQLDRAAPDYAAVLDDMSAALQRLAVLQLVSGRLDDDEAAVLAPLAERLSPEDVQLYYQIAVNGRRDLAVGRDPRVAFEMTLLRMLAFRPAAEADGPRTAAAQRAAAPPRSGAAPAGKTAGSPRPEPSAAAPASPTANHDSVAPRNGAASSRTAPPAANVDWPALLQTLDLRGPARQLADHCDLKSHAGNAWQLVLPPDKEHLNTQQLRARVEAALREHFGRELKVTIASGAPQRVTPAEIRKANENERMRAAREAIEADPNVRAVQAAFDATVEADSIRATK